MSKSIIKYYFLSAIYGPIGVVSYAIFSVGINCLKNIECIGLASIESVLSSIISLLSGLFIFLTNHQKFKKSIVPFALPGLFIIALDIIIYYRGDILDGDFLVWAIVSLSNFIGGIYSYYRIMR